MPDASFLPTALFTQADVRQAIQQPDGKRLFVGYFQRAQGSPTSNVVRLLPNSNQLDPVFQANTLNLRGTVDEALLLPNGQLLLATSYGDSLRLGTVARRTLLRLNADGTPDASFNAGLGLPAGVAGSHVGAMAAQSNGKVLITGDFTRFNGQSVGRLVRLETNGSLDVAFQAAGTGLDQNGYALEVQPDGKILVGGRFTTVHGQNSPALVRLLANGQRDTGFAPTASPTASILGLALQTNGNIVVAQIGGTLSSNFNTLQRLLPSGAQDPNFALDPYLQTGFLANLTNPAATPVRVQADGKILIASTQNRYNGIPLGSLIRLTASGALDGSFTSPPLIANGNSYVNTVQPLANGNLLVAGSPGRLGGPASPMTPVAVLLSSGSRDLSFAPNIQWTGTVHSVVQQPNGQLLIGGDFNEVNGTDVQNIARLNPDGSVDVAFTTTGADGEVASVALQADGKVLLAGNFVAVNGTSRPAVARLLSTGALDAAFVPAILATTTASPNELASGRQALALANGQVLVSGTLHAGVGYMAGLLRLNGTNGQLDTGFQSAAQAPYGFDAVVVQPNGNVLLAGYFTMNNTGYDVCRLLSSGARDPAFTLTPQLTSGNVTALALDATGRIYVGGNFTTYAGRASAAVARLRLDGTLDNAFTSALPTTAYHSVNVLAIQPNGRLLLGGYLTQGNMPYGTARLLATGATDASYAAADGPDWNVETLLIQSDGKIVAGGDFLSAAGLPYTGLVRLVDANVLSSARTLPQQATIVWPNPTHDSVTIRVDESNANGQLTIRDVLGREVHTQTLSSSTNRVDLSAFVKGVYLLRITTSSGVSVKRVVLE